MKEPDELDHLFSQLRQSPTDADPARIAPAFETRVAARVRAARANAGTTWYWRWSVVFGAAAIVCAGMFVHNYLSLSDPALAAFDDETMFVMSLF